MIEPDKAGKVFKAMILKQGWDGDRSALDPVVGETDNLLPNPTVLLAIKLDLYSVQCSIKHICVK